MGDFHLLRRLGKGGMAEVWLAEQTSLKRNVALKLLRRDLTDDQTYIRRFETEAKAAAGLNHANIVQVYAVGQLDGQHYIVQEYVQGQTLRTLLQRKGPLDMTVAMHIMRQVAAALQAAAERGIVHRDIKPENIMLTRKGEVKVADFGLAQLTQGEPLHLTQEGVTMGTPLYMSPEQVKGNKLDQRSDIYSFGVTSYHMLAGRPPFQGGTAVSVAVQHLQNEPDELGSLRPDLPKAVCDLVHRMLAKEPDARYPDAKSVGLDVRRILKALKEAGDEDGGTLAELALTAPGQSETERAAARRTRLARCALCVLVALTAAGIGWWRRTPDLRLTEAREDPIVKKAGSARDQYLTAMFLGDNEEGWRAVIDHWPEQEHTEWTVRSWEQLALLYIKDRNRTADARLALDKLGSYERSYDERCRAEARLGEAALAAYAGEITQAKAILGTNSADFERHLKGSWRQLHDELQQLVRAENPAAGARTQLTPQRPATTQSPDSGRCAGLGCPPGQSRRDQPAGSRGPVAGSP
jgi:serine/threonine-protein kinase